MIDKQKIQQAAKDHAKNHSIPTNLALSFSDGVEWVLKELDPMCNAAADLIEKLRSENAKQLEMIRAQSECLCNIIKSMQEDAK